MLCKSMDWFLYDADLRYERVNSCHASVLFIYSQKHQEARGFLKISGGIERDQRHDVG